MNESTKSGYDPHMYNSVVVANVSSLVITDSKVKLIQPAYVLSLSTFSICYS